MNEIHAHILMGSPHSYDRWLKIFLLMKFKIHGALFTSYIYFLVKFLRIYHFCRKVLDSSSFKAASACAMYKCSQVVVQKLLFSRNTYKKLIWRPVEPRFSDDRHICVNFQISGSTGRLKRESVCNLENCAFCTSNYEGL